MFSARQTDRFLKTLPASHPARSAAIRRELLDMSRQFARKAHAPYSNFHVGAAILTQDGHRYGGANVETSRPGGLCAERNAIVSGVADNMVYQDVAALDLVAVSCIDLPAEASLSDGTPCGACRQVMREFSHADTVVIIDDKKEGVLVRMHDLLPEGFMFGKAQSTAPGHPAELTTSELLVEYGCSDDMAV